MAFTLTQKTLDLPFMLTLQQRDLEVQKETAFPILPF